MASLYRAANALSNGLSSVASFKGTRAEMTARHSDNPDSIREAAAVTLCQAKVEQKRSIFLLFSTTLPLVVLILSLIGIAIVVFLVSPLNTGILYIFIGVAVASVAWMSIGGSIYGLSKRVKFETQKAAC